MPNDNASDSTDIGSDTANVGKKKMQCPRCEGSGVVESNSGNNTVTCPRCDGSGEVDEA